MGRVVTALTASLLIVLSVFSFPMFLPKVHGASSNVQWQDDFESYRCGSFPNAWSLRFNGQGNSSQYVDCTTAYHGTNSLHLQGQDVITTGSRWAAMADRPFSPVGASEIGYSVFVRTGPLHFPGTGEVACDVGFEVGSYLRPDKNLWGVYPALVQFTDNRTILPGDMTYTPGAWYHVTASVDMFNNAFHLEINDTDAGTFQADTYGNGTFLPSISALALVSNHAGRECWFDQVTVESTTIIDNGDFSHGLDRWSTVSVRTSQNSQGVDYPIFQNLTGPPSIVSPFAAFCFPSSRLGNPFLSIDVPYGADGYVEQTVTVPAYGKAQLSLLSWGWVGSSFAGSGLVDAYARLVDANGTEHFLAPPPKIVGSFSGYWTPPPMTSPLGDCTGFQPQTLRFDLTAFSGQTVKLRLGATTQFIGSTTDAFALFDDVQLSSASFLVPTTISLSADPSTVAEAASAPASTRVSTTVLDQVGNVMEGVPVSFNTTDGKLSSPNGVTNSNGVTAVDLIGPNISPCNPQLACNPQSVTVTAAAAATAVTVVRNSLDVTFLPLGFRENTWKQSSSFHVFEVDVKLGQYLGIVATAWNWCVFLRICHGFKIHLDKVPPIRIFLLTPTDLFSSTARSNFANALASYFGLSTCSQTSQPNCIPPSFSPLATLILEVPVVQAVNALFHLDLTPPVTFDLPDYTKWLTENNYIKTTPSGYIDAAFTFSVNKTDTKTLVQDALQAIAQDATLFYKADVKGVVDTILANLQLVLDVGDVTVSVITSDLNQNGSLQSYTLFELSHLPGEVSNLLEVTGIASKIIDMLIAAVKAGSDPADLLDLARTIVTGIDIEVELLSKQYSLSNNDLFSWFETGLNIVTTLIDPPNATIVPSFYDSSGRLVLGYNPQDGTITFSGPAGILLPNGHGYLALLAENSTSPSKYSEILNGLGTNALVPYEVRLMSYNQTVPVRHYFGELPGGSNVTVPAELNPDGSLVPGMQLKPTVSAHVDVDSHSLTIIAKATLSDGSLTAASNGTLVIGGTNYPMTEVNSSTFEATVSFYASTPGSFSVYLFSPGHLGGFAPGLTPVPPTTLATASPPAKSSGWNNANVTLALTASDGRDSEGQSSEVKEISYVLTGVQTGSRTVPGNTASITIYAEGNTTISYYATDSAGNKEATRRLLFLVDKTPPAITSSQEGQSFVLRQAVLANAQCADALSGIDSCILPTGFLDTRTVGPHSYIVTSTDIAGNTAVHPVRYQVHYNYIPLSTRTAGQASRTLPVRFRLTDALSNLVPTATARIWVDSLTSPGKSSGSSNTGNYFRYDTTDNQYIFNLSTTGMATGSHTLFVTLDDGTTHTININLT